MRRPCRRSGRSFRPRWLFEDHQRRPWALRWPWSFALPGVPALTAASIATSVIVLIMVIASITLLPAFLGLAGHWINRLGLRRKKSQDDGAVCAGWEHWGGHVTNNA